MPRVEDRGRIVKYPNNIVFRRIWLQDQDNYYYVCLDCGWTCLESIGKIKLLSENFYELQQHVKDHQDHLSPLTFSIEDELNILPSKQEPKPRRMLRIGIHIPT